MDDVSGYGRANGVSPEGDTTSEPAGIDGTPDAFGLGAYTGSTVQTVEEEAESTQAVERTVSTPTIQRTAPNQSKVQIEPDWQTVLDEPIIGGPAVHDGQLFVTGRSGRLYALDGADGTESWQSPPDQVATTRPTVGAGVVVVGNEDGLLRAYDVTDGAIQWTYDVHGTVEAAPAIEDDVVYTTSARGEAYLIDAKRGDRRTAFGHASRSVCAIAAGQDSILFASVRGGVESRSTTDGRKRWRCVPDQAVAAPPVVAGDRAFVASIDDNAVLAIDRVTGTVEAQFEASDAVWGRPIVTDDTLVVADQSGVVSAFDRGRATPRWQVEVEGSVWAGPVVENERVYLADDVGEVYAFDVDGGELLGQFAADAPITTAPAVAAGAVFVATENGSVYALGEAEI